jgi:chromosomal replication initiation ATPase DnaA
MIAISVIAQRVADYYQVSLSALKEKQTAHSNQVVSVARKMSILLCKRQGWNRTSIANFFGIDPTTISAHVRDMTEDAQRYPQTEALLEQLSA